MESVRFHDSKLKLLNALLFRSFHETEAPTAGFCSVFICGRAYWLSYTTNSTSDFSKWFYSFLLKLCSEAGKLSYVTTRKKIYTSFLSFVYNLSMPK